MKIKDIYESTTAGSIATVAAPMSTQKRSNVGKGVYGNEKLGNLLTGKKTNKKYANSINESKMKELAIDIKNMDNGNFQKKYKKSKDYFVRALGDPNKMPVQEAQLDEDDLIIVPGQGHKLKTGFIPHGESRLDHEVEMARSDLFSAAKNAKQVYDLIADLTEEEGLEGWVQEKIIKANDYLNTIREYLEGKQLQHNEMTGGVIAAGGVGESLEHFDHEISMAKGDMRSAVKAAKRIYHMLDQRDELMAWQQSYITLASDYLDSVADSMEEEMHSEDFNEGIVDKIKGVVRREKAKGLPVLQTRRDYAMGKAGDAYNKGEIRKGNQYSAYAEKDRKKKGDPSTNPTGTYRTKTTDYKD